MQTILFESTHDFCLRPDLGYIHIAHRCLSTLIVALLALVVAGGARAAQAAEFKQASYSRTSPRGEKVVLKFGDKQKFVLSGENGKTLVEGTYKVMNDQIEFTDENGPLASKDAKPGKYKWQLANGKLNFIKVEDESEGRSKGIAGATWTLEN
jgi:hypothetical protein